MDFYEERVETALLCLCDRKKSQGLFIFLRKDEIIMARSARLESGFQDRLIKRIKALLPGCFVFKMDQVQGIPDLLILFGGRWASLECKRSSSAHHRPNQDYYVGVMDMMSFSRFVFPENVDKVLGELYEFMTGYRL